MKNSRQSNNYVAILAGGIGSKFYPMDKEHKPQQFRDIFNTGKTLLQSTFERFRGFIPKDHIYIITSHEYVSLVQEQLPNLPLENIVAEPERKNTAASVAYISFKLKKLNPKANLIIAPSDHLIGDQEIFEESCFKALEFTEQQDAFVTLGIEPDHANSAYGYIRRGYQRTEDGVFKAIQFTEKPVKSQAEKFLEEDNVYWNSGIFIGRAADLVDAFWMHATHIYDLFRDVYDFLNTEKEAEVIEYVYTNCRSISIDYALMEKANNVYIIPSKFEWNDLGTWTRAWESYSQENYAFAYQLPKKSKAGADAKKMEILELENMVIIETPDTILVCKKDYLRSKKDYAINAKEIKRELYI